MVIRILASGSTGNCYVIDGINESIMIEAGIPFDQIKKKLEFKMSNISCVLLTHEHQDHAKSINDMIHMGKRVYASAGTFEALGIDNYFASPVKAGDVINTEEFTIKAFSTEHDCREPLGFLIYSKTEYKKIVFATDTYYLKYMFSGVNVFMIEVNFVEKSLQESVDDNRMPEAGAARIKKSHMSLGRVIKFFDTMSNAKRLLHTKHIIPIHISSRFGNAEYTKEIIESRYMIPVHINERRIIV